MSLDSWGVVPKLGGCHGVLAGVEISLTPDSEKKSKIEKTTLAHYDASDCL